MWIGSAADNGLWRRELALGLCDEAHAGSFDWLLCRGL